MKILMMIFFIVVVIVELFMIEGCYVSIKYQMEMTENIYEILGLAYSMLDTLGLIIVFDLLYLCVMHVLFFRK